MNLKISTRDLATELRDFAKLLEAKTLEHEILRNSSPWAVDFRERSERLYYLAAVLDDAKRPLEFEVADHPPIPESLRRA
jgi:hypothetical protein